MLLCRIQSLQSLYGRCSAIFVKLLSGVKFNARKLSMMLIILCFVLSFPAAAGIISPVNGVISMQTDSFGYMYSRTSDEPHFRYNEDVPAYFEFSDDSYVFRWRDGLPLLEMHSTYTSGDMVFSVLVNLGDGTDDLLVSFDSFVAQPYFSATFISGESATALFSYTGTLEMFVDDTLVYSVNLEHTQYPIIPSWQGTVTRYIEYRITTSSPSEHVYDWVEPHSSYEWLEVRLPGLLVNSVSTIIEDISISVSNIEQGVDDINDGIQDLNQTASDTYVTVTQIEEGVVSIESEVTNMHEELSDSDSNIWQAGATIIKESVSALFVPPEDEFQHMVDMAQLSFMEKTGDAYVLFDQAMTGHETIVSEFTGAGRETGINFPGVIVNLPNIGTYTIIPAQQVNSVFLTDVFLIFQEILGVIVSILCGLAFLHLMEDFIICLLSGVTYWGFIRSRHR